MEEDKIEMLPRKI